MTATQIAAREDLYRRIRDLSDADAAQVIEFIDSLACPEAYKDHMPNEETARIIEESLDPTNLIECDNIQDMFKKCGVKCSD